MVRIDSQMAKDKLQQAEKITFLTGAGVSTGSGVPDYRSLSGVYQGIERPEYLLSYTCMEEEPEKFYSFVKTLYHPSAVPNAIHLRIAALEKTKEVWVVSQNIDGLHQKAGSQHLVNFHGDLYDCYCRKCGKSVPAKAYLHAEIHEQCNGQLRPNIVLYEEGLDEQKIAQAIQAVSQAELVVIVGTSFQVHPFCDLIHYASKQAEVLVINQTPIHLPRQAYYVEADAATIFAEEF
ncbi:NAD-dependent protein deacylase [Erwinia sp. CPCC 100877]|nr:NAD-dependent protein deacylase [Erwinia sp. CPCC 100877]